MISRDENGRKNSVRDAGLTLPNPHLVELIGFLGKKSDTLCSLDNAEILFDPRTPDAVVGYIDEMTQQWNPSEGQHSLRVLRPNNLERTSVNRLRYLLPKVPSCEYQVTIQKIVKVEGIPGLIVFVQPEVTVQYTPQTIVSVSVYPAKKIVTGVAGGFPNKLWQEDPTLFIYPEGKGLEASLDEGGQLIGKVMDTVTHTPVLTVDVDHDRTGYWSTSHHLQVGADNLFQYVMGRTSSEETKVLRDFMDNAIVNGTTALVSFPGMKNRYKIPLHIFMEPEILGNLARNAWYLSAGRRLMSFYEDLHTYHAWVSRNLGVPDWAIGQATHKWWMSAQAILSL